MTICITAYNERGEQIGSWKFNDEWYAKQTKKDLEAKGFNVKIKKLN